MRLDPVTTARRLAWRMAAGLLVVVALFAVATLAPVQVYKPSCDDRSRRTRSAPLRLDGPLRPEYVEMLTRAVRREGFRYWRIGDTVFVPPLPVFDGNGRWGWTDFVTNTEWRIAQAIVNGYSAHGCASPPEGVRRLYDDIKGVCGVLPERGPDDQLVYALGVSISNDCDLFRAAVIRVEGMPQPLPELDRFIAPGGKRLAPASTDSVPQRW